MSAQQEQLLLQPSFDDLPADIHTEVKTADIPTETCSVDTNGHRFTRNGLTFIFILAVGLAARPSSVSVFLGETVEDALSHSTSSWPYTIVLSREKVPVLRGNKTVSHKTSYTGKISVGHPPQEFKVIFDTGSAHVVLPASTCTSEACLAHKRYNISESETASVINSDGDPVPEDQTSDQVTIGYGTGQVVGEFATEAICLGGLDDAGPCLEMNLVLAVEMTTVPFKTFGFDGIFGLAFESLAVTPEFGFFKMLGQQDRAVSLQFGVFLAEEGSGESSELTLGGYNPKRLLSPLRWVPVARDHGHWQVNILGIRIGDKWLDICLDGKCQGIVDTGTSHFGVPVPAHKPMMELLSADGLQGVDCRTGKGLTVEVVLDGINLTLTPENYMRPLSLPPGVKFGSMLGTYGAGIGGENTKGQPLDGNASNVSRNVSYDSDPVYDENEPWQCAPKLMPVKIGLPTPNPMFILGEPVLSRYYTVYDRGAVQVGFSYNTREQNLLALEEEEDMRLAEDASVEEDEQTFLFQMVVVITPQEC